MTPTLIDISLVAFWIGFIGLHIWLITSPVDDGALNP